MITALLFCRRWHPDRHTDKDARQRLHAEERFKAAAKAYEVLFNHEERKLYDQVTHDHSVVSNTVYVGDPHRPQPELATAVV